MHRIYCLLGALLLSLTALHAQRTDETATLLGHVRTAAGFDNRSPREMVYLHVDNNGYYEDETLWYRAYVVRAASLQPRPLSGVLYVELLDAGGRLVESQTLQVDSAGRAEGAFRLQLPVRSGYYELRAYTREMVNWGKEACHSRIIPVFRRPRNRKKPLLLSDIDVSRLEIDRPADNDRSTRATPRIVRTDTNGRTNVTFRVEGGRRVAGLPQRVAFRLEGDATTDGRDTLTLRSAAGEVLGRFPTVHRGMGCLYLPAEAAGAYAEWQGKRFALPEPDAAADYALSVPPVGPEGPVVQIAGTPRALTADSLLGIAVVCRGAVCYCDTLRMGGGDVELTLPATALRDGVNRIVLFSATGRTLAERCVWHDGQEPGMQVEVRQNSLSYAPYAPIVLDITVRDAQGRPVETDFSLSVRGADSEFVRSDDIGVSTALLLGSELSGYLPRPYEYFGPDCPDRAAVLDLLLLLQGWQPNRFEEMCGRETFDTPQPIEDHLTLNGTVWHDNDKRQAYPGLNLSLKMYSLKGGALEAKTTTDAAGRFAFVSNVDYVGDYIAQLTTTDNEGHKVDSRVALDRWFSPAMQEFDPELLATLPPLPPATLTDDPTAADTAFCFAWTDTIPDLLRYQLGEVKVKAKRRYKGFTGNRYTYMGGEKAGMRRGKIFINLGREVERYKDAGGDPGYIMDFLNLLDSRAETEYVAESDQPIDAAETMRNAIHAGVTYNNSPTDPESINDIPDEPTKTVLWSGQRTTILLNNDTPDIPLDTAPAEWFRSVAITQGYQINHLHDLEPGEDTGHPGNLILLYEEPGAYRNRSAKGSEKRNLRGFAEPVTFKAPDYRQTDKPTDRDVRRTLGWLPSVRTDAEGHASVILYNNGTPDQHLRITLRGITERGEFVEWER